MVVIRVKTRGKLDRKQRFVKFVIDRIAKDVSAKELARRKRAKEAYQRYLEKNRITKREIKEWAKDLPRHKQEIFSMATTMLAGTVPAFWLMASSPITTEVARAIQPIASAVEPYWIPLMGIGVGTALAYDIWYLPHSQVRIKLKKLGRWADHEIDWIIAHLKHHKKKNPRMFHGVKRHHLKRLHKVM